MKRLTGILSSWFFAAGGAVAAPADSPFDVLRSQYPALYKLYKANEGYRTALADYANRQGFRRPFENLATVVHEIIHIDSAVHQGYFVDGIYYEPYLRRDAWPALTNDQVRPYLASHEKGVIYQLYALNTPQNHLGNLIDEINAYGHVMPFICRNEPESVEKQVKNLVGFLNLVEGYLRTMRTLVPQEYNKLATNQESRGAFNLVMQRAWAALAACGVPQSSMPAQEAAYFVTLTSPVKQATK